MTIQAIPKSKTEFIVTFEEAPLQEVLIAAANGSDHKGIVPFPKNDDLKTFLNHHYHFQRRYKLEENTNFRHPIPYGVFYRVNKDGVPEFFVYQRTTKTGEGRLAGKHSIGIGGHVEATDFFDPEFQLLSFTQKLGAVLFREFIEEFSWTMDEEDEQTTDLINHSPALLINNDVSQDQFHLGLVPFVRLPDSIDNITSKEEDQIAVGFFTLDHIREHFLGNLESWSSLIVNNGDMLSHVGVGKVSEVADVTE